MTIAVTIQVMDGMVFAADSTSTLVTSTGDVVNTYDGANKIVNLCKGKPVAAMFWGAGSLGSASLTTLSKDLRLCLAGKAPAPDGSDWELGEDWAVHDVADRVKQFVAHVTAEADDPPQLGIAVGGYTSGGQLSERYEIIIDEHGNLQGPEDAGTGSSSALAWRGQPEAITRLVWGFGTDLPRVLVDNFGASQDNVGDIVDILGANLGQDPVSPAMPIQDAIELGEFLVDVTKKWVRFLPGAPTVGGPTEIAAITKHEGFKWVRRKHYYDSAFNPAG